jgi:RHH-type proline utilization regulon transcriptional repressor/proline dehydrogenase/delta 1-pyrroline-5-carboxylate dehydrogenase
MSSGQNNAVPDVTSTTGVAFAQSLADESVSLVSQWLSRAAKLHRKPNASSRRLAGVLKDPEGPAFALGFVDRVARPEDLVVAARNFRELSRSIPAFLPPVLRALISLGGTWAPLMPGVVVPIARWALKTLIAHLIIDARDQKLAGSLRRLKKKGDQLNINLLGEAVLGDQEADRRLQGVSRLIARDDVDYVSVKVSAVTSQLSTWAFHQTIDRVVERLIPLYQQAQATTPPTFINLDMEEFKDLDLTIEVFQRVLSDPSVKNYTGGIVLQAYLPEAMQAMKTLQTFASARVKAGGAPIKVRVVKGANLQMEQVDAALHDWPLTVLPSKEASDTHYKRVLEWALTPQRTRAVRIGVAGHNLFDLAFAHLLATHRGVASAVDIEMLIGMAPDQADAVRESAGRLILYTPVVQPAEFDAAVGYLVRRLDENASPDNFMSAVFDLQGSSDLFAREEQRFRRSLAGINQKAPAANRTQNRSKAPSPLGEVGFHNEPDTDSSLAANREWVGGVRALAGSKEGKSLGKESLRKAAIPESAGPINGGIAVDDLVAKGRAAGAKWAARPAVERAAILHSAAEELGRRRGQLLAVMMDEAGKTIPEGDPEVSEAIDFARYYADRAIELGEIDGANFEPARFTLVTPPWNFPIAIPAGSVVAALAAGSAVAIKPAPQVPRCGAVLVEALWAAGVPQDVLQLVDIEEGQIGRGLISHPGVDRLILTGGFETAKLFRSFRAGLPLLAETSGKNAIVVTPSADLDLAVADIVKSAFGHAGQKCSAASLVIMVGSVASSQRFRRQLKDAVTTLRVGYPSDPEAVMGPIIEPPGPKLSAGLMELGKGERWLVEPAPLDDTGRLWSPGIRDNVWPKSVFHQTEYFGPILGLMHVSSLDEALAVQNGVEYGLTAGIHSLDVAEVSHWLESVEAGNLYVNRGITGAIVQRQPFGGWKKSSVGPGAKAGGPNYLFGLGQWRRAESKRVKPSTLEPYAEDVARAGARDSSDDHGFLVRSFASDSKAWQDEFGVSKDVSAVGVERNVFRYRPQNATVRATGFVPAADTVRVLMAGLRAGANIELSVSESLPDAVMALLRKTPAGWGRVTHSVQETERAFILRIMDRQPDRIRLLGSRADAMSVALDGAPEVAVYADDVTESGRVEMLPFVKEQAVSVTAHRFGAPDPRFVELPI